MSWQSLAVLFAFTTLALLVYLIVLVWSFEHQIVREANNDLISAYEKFYAVADHVDPASMELTMAIAKATGGFQGGFHPKIGKWKKWPHLTP